MAEIPINRFLKSSVTLFKPPDTQPNFYSLTPVYPLTICVTSSPCLQNVHTQGSEFTYRSAHSPIKLVFYRSQPLRMKWLTPLSGPVLCVRHLYKWDPRSWRQTNKKPKLSLKYVHNRECNLWFLHSVLFHSLATCLLFISVNLFLRPTVYTTASAHMWYPSPLRGKTEEKMDREKQSPCFKLLSD